MTGRDVPPDVPFPGSGTPLPGLASYAVPAYLDHAATTPMRPEAVEAMLPFLTERFGNPSGAHAVAREARKALDEAREVVAEGIGARPGEVVFTSGGTEADNLAVLGVHAARPGRTVVSAAEHHAVLHAAESVQARLAPVTSDGTVDLGRLAGLLDPSVTLVSVMLANNEVGTLQPLAEVAALVRERSPGAVLHTDAVAAFPWVDVAGLASGADLVAVSAHKFGGPKGVGALVVRQGVAVAPLLHGGGQERDRRSGTSNVPGVVGMAAAVAATVAERDVTARRVASLRDALADGLLASVPGSAETGDRSRKVAGNCHLTFEGVEAESLLMLLDAEGVYASAASSCASGAADPSHVLAAMGLDPVRAAGALRLTLGATTTPDDVSLALEVIPAAVQRLRAVSL